MLEIVLGDLVERRVSRALRICVQIAPLAGLCGDRERAIRLAWRGESPRKYDDRHDEGAQNREPYSHHCRSRRFWCKIAVGLTAALPSIGAAESGGRRG